MASNEEVINGNINSLKELKDLVKSFKDELATAKEGSQEWENAVEGLSVAQERLDKINKAAKGTLEGYNNSAKDSINTLKARIKELNTERNAMDMNSQEYADATAQLKELIPVSVRRARLQVICTPTSATMPNRLLQVSEVSRMPSQVLLHR